MNATRRISMPLVLGIAIAHPGQAAPVYFNTPANIAAVTDVSTVGSSLFAYDWSAATTINGVPFLKAAVANGVVGTNLTLANFGSQNATAFTSVTAPYGALDATYRAMLTGAVYNGTAATTGTVTLPGLTPGRQYLLQLWVGDPRTGATTTRIQKLNGGNTVDFDFNVGNVGGAVGQVASGTIFADAAAPSFTMSTTAGSVPQINGIQLRDVTGLGWWNGANGSTWDEFTTPNFSIDTLGTPGTFSTAKALSAMVVFGDTQTPGGLPVGTTAVSVVAGGVTGSTAVFANTVGYSLTSADAVGLTGAGGVLIQGGGEVAFNGSNTYTGSTVVNNGALVLNSGTALADSSVLSLADAATASAKLGAAETLGGLSGGGAAGGNLNLQANNLTVAGNGTDVTYNGSISGAGGLIKEGTGIQTLGGVNAFAGATTVNAGRLNLSGTLTNSDLSVAAGAEIGGEGTAKSISLTNATVHVNPSTTEALASATALTASGTNTVKLAGPPGAGAFTVLKYTGTLTGSTANFFFDNTAGYRAVTFADTGSAITLDLGTAVRTWGGVAGTWENAGAGTFWVEGDQKFVAGDSVVFNDPGAAQTVTLSGTLQPASITVANTAGNDYTFSGAGVIASGSIVKNDAGKLTLTSANTFSGGATINGGTVNATVNLTQNSIGTGPIHIASGATMEFNDTNTAASSATPLISNAFTGSGTLRLIFAVGTTARNTLMSNLSGFSGLVQLSRASAAATADKWNLTTVNSPGTSVLIDTGTQLFIPASQVVTFADVNLIGTGNNENRGALRILGTLNAPLTLAGSTTIGTEGGTVNGNITCANAGAQTLTLGTTASTGNFVSNGVISDGAGVLSLTKVAAGISTLQGANTYSGTTTISAGTIRVGNAAVTAVANAPSTLNPGTGQTGTLGTGPVTNNATLDLRRADTAYVLGNDIGGTGALTVNGVAGSLVTLAGNNSFSGAVTIAFGGLRIRNSSSLGSGTKTITLTNGTAGQPSLRLDGSGGAISLPAALSFSTSSSTGDGGIINEAGDNTIAGSFTLAAGGGGTRFRVDGGTLTLSGSMTPNTTAHTVILDGPGNGTFSGVLSDSGANIPELQKFGDGVWTLTNSNTYTGATTVLAGKLIVDGSLGNSPTTVAAGATLGGSGTIAGPLTSNGTLSPGQSAGTLTTGTAALNGTLAVEVDGAAADKLKVNGDLTIGAGATLTVNLLAGGFTAASYVIAECTGSLTGTFSSVPAGYQVAYTANTAVLSQAAPAGYAAWAALKGLDGSPGKAAGFTDDPDGDGLANGVEFVLDGEPLSGVAKNLPTAAIEGAALVFSYVRRDDSEYLNPGVEFDTDLVGPWTAATDGVTATITVQENGLDPDVVRVAIPLNGNLRLFVRMRVAGP